MNNAALRRLGVAALGSLTDEQIAADPGAAMVLAQSVMRAAIEGQAAFTDRTCQAAPPRKEGTHGPTA